MKEYIVNSEEECLFYEHDELIRCKDCKAFNGLKCVRNNMIAVRTDDYCSRAERREE